MTILNKITSFKGSRLVVVILGIIGIAILATMIYPGPAPARELTKLETNSIRTPVLARPELPETRRRETDFDRQQILCLAINAYFEAGNQGHRGKIAVSNVVMNRVRDRRFPNTPCSVIYQRTRGVCQFSWVCQGRRHIRNQAQYAGALRAAELVYFGNAADVTNGSLFFHATYVRPRWNRRVSVVIGDHIFYRG